MVFTLLLGMVVLNRQGASKARGELLTVERQSELTEAVHELELAVLNLQRNCLIFSHTGHPSLIVRVSELDSRVSKLLEGALSQTESSELLALYDGLEELRVGYSDAFQRLTEDRARRDELLSGQRDLAARMTSCLEALPADGEGRKSRAREAFALADNDFMEYMESPSSAFVRSGQEHLNQVRSSLAGEASSELLVLLSDYEENFLQMVQAVRGYLFLSNVVLAGQAAEITYKIGLIRDEFRQERAAVIAKLEADSIDRDTQHLVIAIVAILLGLVGATIAGRSITRPIAQLTSTLGRLARGERDVDVPCRERADEIGEMAEAAEVFRMKNLETQELLVETRDRGRQLQEQAGALERANEELEQFAYVASHDLQEPLRMVASFVQLLGQEYSGELSEEADEYIRFASEGAKRMQELINDLLDLSRVGSVEREPQEVDTEALIASVLRDLQPRLDSSGMRLEIESLPTIRAFPNQLRQVFQNFITNSIKYRTTSTEPLLTVSAQEGEEGWVFVFDDNGIGIDQKHYDRIFKIFQRLHNRADYEGSGMGLAIVKKIAELHEGKVWVESKPGEGSRFYFQVGVLEV